MDRGIAASACGLVLVAVLCLAAAGCIRDTRDLHAASAVPELVSSHLSSRSWVLCPLLGPRTHHPGVYGTDLGFSAEDPAHPDRLALLFGDTWAKPLDACQYPVGKSDDLQAWLPRARPRGEGEDLCKSLGYELHEASDATSWSRLRLFPSRVAASDDARIDTGALRTPLAAFSDGKQLYAIVGRNDPVYCNVARDCPAAMSCTTDPAYRGKPVGMCGKSMEAAPLYCRDDHDCLPTVSCKRPARGLCVAQVPFTLQRAGGDVSPRWYYDDPRQGVANTLYVAAAVWPERPSDYAVIRRFETQRFVNVAARTVAHFDPQDASHNDYTPGHETLLLWGRPSFVTHGAAQSLPFFAYVRLDALSGEANADAKLEPQFFAGYDGAGAPR
ncbi:MAG TPA: hypothetical protein VHM19_11190, partial [Polyangiales bacterium]|nr:hypothetical protein [Polyangiales bacterium]